ncbi:hypothetical protein [Spirosoma montaniterrae]|nr:hypothetical protein [Spirosoma montaniterrae]
MNKYKAVSQLLLVFLASTPFWAFQQYNLSKNGLYGVYRVSRMTAYTDGKAVNDVELPVFMFTDTLSATVSISPLKEGMVDIQVRQFKNSTVQLYYTLGDVHVKDSLDNYLFFLGRKKLGILVKNRLTIDMTDDNEGRRRRSVFECIKDN